MAVKIRLSRIGKKHRPFSRIVVMDARKKRDGECLENLGTYDNIKSKMVDGFNEERFSYWVSQGAIPTDSVKKIRKTIQKAAATQ
jgi:small subunit ribosomal protein S16